MEKRFNFTIEDVLNKQFNVDFKGYSSVEVDEFLDHVIEDYQAYEQMLKELGDRMQEYEKQISAWKAKVIELEGKQDLAKEKASSAVDGNVDILKRLTRLENAVFKKQ